MVRLKMRAASSPLIPGIEKSKNDQVRVQLLSLLKSLLPVLCLSAD